MKKVMLALCVTCVLALAVQAADGKKEQKLTAEQKEVRKELLAKYDTNKDGKLSKEERSKISDADKEKLEKAGLGRKKKEKN